MATKISKLIVDGSYNQDIEAGGIGGYILSGDKKLITTFSQTSKANVFKHNFELLSIISGLQLALKNNIDSINVFNDDHDLYFQIRKHIKKFKKNNVVESDFKKFRFEKRLLMVKLASLIKKFKHIDFFIHKCKSAHNLCRLYITHAKDNSRIEIITKTIFINSRFYYNKVVPIKAIPVGVF